MREARFKTLIAVSSVSRTVAIVSPEQAHALMMVSVASIAPT